MEVIIKEAGNRLDKSLADLTELSRSQANEAIKAGTVLVNGKSAKAKYVVKEGDVITYVLPEEEVLEYKAEDIPLDIIYDRIDKDTSGLLMIAKNDKAHNALAAELKDKKSLRKYVAIVHGNLPNDRGVIEAPIGRSDKDRKKQAVTAKGKPAVTRFTVLERFGNYTLVELQLETGRTHQIRVHMAYIGHPVAGDPLYGPRKTLKGHGQFLHAKTLGFTHPTTGELVEFTAEEPIIFKETLEKLRKA